MPGSLSHSFQCFLNEIMLRDRDVSNNIFSDLEKLGFSMTQLELSQKNLILEVTTLRKCRTQETIRQKRNCYVRDNWRPFHGHAFVSSSIIFANVPKLFPAPGKLLPTHVLEHNLCDLNDSWLPEFSKSTNSCTKPDLGIQKTDWLWTQRPLFPFRCYSRGTEREGNTIRVDVMRSLEGIGLWTFVL